MSNTDAQPSIEYMLRLVGLTADLTNRPRLLAFVRNTPGHSWCNELLQELDYSIVNSKTDEEYGKLLHNYLSQLSIIFQQGAWFKTEKKKYAGLHLITWNNINKIARV